MSLKLLQPSWNAPQSIRAFSTTRVGGFSREPWDSFNLALHVKDELSAVNENRCLLQESTELPNPRWLTQTHSTKVIEHSTGLIDADGCFTTESKKSCIVMTADCLPVLFCNEEGSWVAATHAGWRGLLDGILSQTVDTYHQPSKLLAWIGPAISQQYFEVGSEVREKFVDKNSSFEAYFQAKPRQKWLCDMVGIAKYELEALGVEVFESNLCTYHNHQDFFSHRRATHQQDHGATTGRMASVIWIEQ